VRVDFSKPPSREELRRSQIHELIRDFPELHPILVTLGIQPRLQGGRQINELLPEEEWLPTLEEALSWRSRPSG
jgi:hypothetical protein